MYTIYDIESGKIVSRQKVINHDDIPDGCDFIAGDINDIRFRIDHETGTPYGFIEQSELRILIRQKAKHLLNEVGATDADIMRLHIDMLTTDDDIPFRKKLAERKRILDIAHDLTNLNPIPQDAENPEYWK